MNGVTNLADKNWHCLGAGPMNIECFGDDIYAHERPAAHTAALRLAGQHTGPGGAAYRAAMPLLDIGKAVRTAAFADARKR